MKLDLNPEMLQTSMELWRKAVDMEIPLASDIRSHFLLRRGELLQSFIKVATNWLTVLRSCEATGDDLRQLEALKDEITSYKSWAEQGISEITKLAEA